MISTVTSNAQKHILSGYVRDSLTNEFLIGATVRIANTQKIVSSNAYGFYSIQVDKGIVNLQINYVGREPKMIVILVESNIHLDVALKEKIQTLSEVVISNSRGNQKLLSTEMCNCCKRRLWWF